MADIKQAVIDKALAVGNAAVNSLWPREFECYMVALELCNGSGRTIDYLSFPIMPDSIQIEDSPAVNMKNTFGGVSVVSSEVFTVKTISLRGNFGRSLKILSRGNLLSSLTSLVGYSYDRNYAKGVEAVKTSELSHNIKTGYGVIKVLESILNKSQGVDSNGLMNKLYFYNLAFGDSYVVKAPFSKFSQSLESNMIWNYDITLKAISPLYLDSSKNTIGNAVKTFSMNVVQSSTNAIIRSLL